MSEETVILDLASGTYFGLVPVVGIPGSCPRAASHAHTTTNE